MRVPGSERPCRRVLERGQRTGRRPPPRSGPPDSGLVAVAVEPLIIGIAGPGAGSLTGRRRASAVGENPDRVASARGVDVPARALVEGRQAGCVRPNGTPKRRPAPNLPVDERPVAAATLADRGPDRLRRAASPQPKPPPPSGRRTRSVPSVTAAGVMIASLRSPAPLVVGQGLALTGSLASG